MQPPPSLPPHDPPPAKSPACVPLDRLNEHGIRAVWVTDLGYEALRLLTYGLILVDPDLDREALNAVVDDVLSRLPA